MNIMITKGEHEFLQNRKHDTYIIGSRMYGTNTPESDIDYLYVYEDFEEVAPFLPNKHQFQYKEEGVDHIYTSGTQFFKNLVTGESTINADVIMFAYPMKDENKLKMVRTYKVVRAYLGMARRDIRQWRAGHHKLVHAARGLHCAEFLMDNRLPRLDVIRALSKINQDKEILLEEHEAMRTRCSELYERDDLKSYFIPIIGNSLVQKLQDANNIKEFHYA